MTSAPIDTFGNKRTNHTVSTDIIASAEEGSPCKDELVTVHDVRYCVPLGVSTHVTRTLRSGKVWEQATHAAIEDYINNVSQHGDAVTMGLFVGDFLPHLSKLVGNDYRVWGLEPNPYNYALARGTVWENGLKNIWIANAGCGEDSGTGPLSFCLERYGRPCGGLCGFRQSMKECTKKALVRVVALDDIIPVERRVILIHLDVEGFELNVLRGAKRIIKAWKPFIIVESGWQGWRAKPEIDFMRQIGYHESKRMDENIGFVHRDDVAEVTP